MDTTTATILTSVTSVAQISYEDTLLGNEVDISILLE